ncbi:NAD(P)H-binding protein [Xanthovirga aplysinae]|uniref:NAD(P)H-binding protein n=1 Tax=Xanthovirga aplysinae TaxID=2529853 RepID=UPI0012BB8747|nr:NAD(P)H-binding protein [Xanthovirga aplysinae]MTI31831.1 SDR family NAD(P)-dependent oxidoreductase [Xanthovirga aplysinae]
MKKEISILGCGWLGLPLGKELCNNGYQVNGSTTNPENIYSLEQAGIKPYLIKLTPALDEAQASDFFDSKILIIAIPPKSKTYGDAWHINQIKSLLTHINGKGIEQVIYISSTSVYPALNKTVTEVEVSQVKESANQAMVQAEILLNNCEKFNTLILRCGGLLGYNRIPGKYFQGKQLTGGNTPVNYIHRDDVVQIVKTLIESDKKNEVYNLVTPIHPLRKDIYLKNVKDYNLIPPIFLEGKKSYKVVDSSKLIQDLNYSFLYPDPLNFDYQ